LKNKSRALKTSEPTYQSEKMTEKLEMYRAFMTGYVKRINEASFNVPIGGVRIGLAKYSRLAQINLKSRVITFSCYAIENVPERGRRYLVLHELAHVKEVNHTKRFWQLVERYEPDYRSIGKNLEKAFKLNVKEEERTSLFLEQKPKLSLLSKHSISEDHILHSSDYDEDLSGVISQYREEEPDLPSYDCGLENFLDWTVE
jgi:phosphoenolpyruvate carboxylase